MYYILKGLGGGMSLDVTGNLPFVHFKGVKDSLGKEEPYNSPTPSLMSLVRVNIYIYTHT